MPYDVASLTVSAFQVYANQAGSIGDSLSFLDFSSNPFTGSPVSGIPTTYALDTANPSISFSSVDYPGLMTSSGSYVGWSETIGDAMYRGLIEVPEPSTLTFLSLGTLGLLACAGRRRKAKA
jgi:hypothetical protein